MLTGLRHPAIHSYSRLIGVPVASRWCSARGGEADRPNHRYFGSATVCGLFGLPDLWYFYRIILRLRTQS